MRRINKESQKKTRNLTKGFTLLELIITLTIIVVVAAIAVPSFQRLTVNSSLKTAARDIASDIALQKERAIAESRMYRIFLNVGSNTYEIRQCQATGSTCAGWNTIQTKNLNRFASDIGFNSGGTTVSDYFFQTRGTVTNGTIRLINGRNSTATITTNIAGRVNVQFNLQ